MIENLVRAYLDDYQSIQVKIDKNFCGGRSDKFHLVHSDEVFPLLLLKSEEKHDCFVYYLHYEGELIIGTQYYIIVENGYRTPLKYRFIVKTKRFNEEFHYAGDDLGCTVGSDKVSFAVWAPTASEMRLKIKGREERIIDMKRHEKGVFRLSLSPDCLGSCYQYLVKINDEWKTSLDPYGKASTPNSGMSVVADISQFKVRHKAEKKYRRYSDAIIYETSVRDITPEGTFKALSENLDYISKLGVTHLQLMPVNDFGSVDEEHPLLYYNWGYDPVQYQCLEGSYSSNVKDPLQVLRDFRTLIENCHLAGLRVNLDVVYNHVYIMNQSSFDILVPYYYFRFDDRHHLSNGSYCGNDFDSKMSMARKYIVDTVKYYVSQFDIDGFRFDLMGIIDLDTTREIIRELKALKDDIMLYGEGWDMPTALPAAEKTTKDNCRQIRDVAFFSDGFREVIKGSTFRDNEKGYGTGNLGEIDNAIKALSGTTFSDREQSVNYVECHDNMTVFDKLNICCRDEGIAGIVERQKLLLGFVLVSQGIAFIHSGQEYCRSKKGIANSYNKPDEINKLRPKDKSRYSEVIEFTRDLISFRKDYLIAAPKSFVFEKKDGCIIYKLTNLRDEQITVILNPTSQDLAYSCGSQRLIINRLGKTDKEVRDTCIIPAVSMAVLLDGKKSV